MPGVPNKCGNCGCEAGCTISTSPSTVVSGSWTGAGGPTLSTSSSSGVVVTPQQSKSTATALQASATIAPTNVAEGGRILIGYVDANNYHFVELRKGSVDGDLRIFQKSTGGGTVQLGTTTTITGYTSGSKSVCVCYYNGKLYAVVDNFVCSAAATITTGSAKAGLGTGTATGTITFTNFVFEHHYIDDPTCPACCHSNTGPGTPTYGFTGGCSTCTAPYPEFVIATLVGLVNNAVASCLDCPSFNGSYVLPYIGTGPFGFAPIPTGACAYSAVFTPKHCNIFGATGFRITFWFGLDFGTIYWGARLEESDGVNSMVVTAGGDLGSTPWPCMEPPPMTSIFKSGTLLCDVAAATFDGIGF